MPTSVQQIPAFTEKDANSIAHDLFGISAKAHPLIGERDQNFLLETGSGQKYVLKIADRSDPQEILGAQNHVLEHLARGDPSLHCPRLQLTLAGDPMGRVQGPNGVQHFVRLLSYVPGHLLVHASPHTPDLLYSLGTFFGRLDRTLADCSHPALRRDFQWDLRQASAVINRDAEHIVDLQQRELIEYFHQRYRNFVAPELSSLRTSVIHNDGNNYNVLVSDIYSHGGTVTGVIDFGDVIESHTVFELAVCTAYAILGKTGPIVTAVKVVSGYHHENPLTELELELLYDLIAIRLCTSVAISARQKKLHPDNSYVTISEGPAWMALEQLAHLSPQLAYYAFRHACEMPACPRTQPLVQWLETNAETIGPVVEPEIRNGDYVVFDLTAGSTEFVDVTDLTDTNLLTKALFGRMGGAGVKVGIGRYDEPRRSYTTQHYRPANSEVDEWRTLHLGIDLFMEPGSPVFAPIDGTVNSFRNNAQLLDYGPTILLRHALQNGIEFFTLYGHLSVESLDGLFAGMPVAKGTHIGTIGDSTVNGQWPPHLHFQIITDLLNYSGDFPGVCSVRDRALWLALCPDPNLILRIPNLVKLEFRSSPEEILETRNDHLGKSLSVSYEKPLTLVQGWKQYVYDHLGREYLDAMNNVCHVGHCHPTVVQAAQRQMAVLNTNTRYLHNHLVEYAKRLCATLPEPLRVCFFVCSGSEANELALRLARAHTKGTDMIVVEGGYHGNTKTLIDISPYKFNGPGGAGSPSHVHTVLMPDRFRGAYKDDRDAGRLYAQQIRELLDRIEQKGQRVAAFISESMLSCGGQIVLPPNYLTEAYQHIRSASGVCIADEVQVGFGRVGTHFWGFQTQGVVPDIVTMGKPIGNGHPMGAVVTTSEIAASFANGMEYFNTFGGNPVSCAVGLAVLEVIQKEDLQKNAYTVGTYLKDELTGLKGRNSMIGDVRGEGLFLGVELVRNSKTLEPAGAEASYVAEQMKLRGVLISTDGPFHNVLKIKPPMVFTKADADRLIFSLSGVLSEPRLKLLRDAV